MITWKKIMFLRTRTALLSTMSFATNIRVICEGVADGAIVLANKNGAGPSILQTLVPLLYSTRDTWLAPSHSMVPVTIEKMFCDRGCT